MSPLPKVSPEVARRRAIFLTSSVVVLVLAVGALFLAARSYLAQGQLPLPGLPEAGVAEQQNTVAPPECTLLVSGSTVGLSREKARVLTDLAARDQNAAEPVSNTEAKVRVLWPEQSGQAAGVADALRGLTGPALDCSATLGPAQLQTMGPMGLTPRAEAVWNAVAKVFGTLPAGGFKPGGVTTGHIPGSSHYEGRAIDYMYRPITPKSIRHGWVLAQWLVAHAEPLLIRTVIFDRKIWTPGPAGADAWRPYTVTHGQVDDPSLQHLDHVHVDVLRNTGA